MRLIYSLTIRWKEKTKKARLLFLELLSLSVVLYFTMMFICKLVETQDDINYYRSKINSNDVVYQLSEYPNSIIPKQYYTILHNLP